ncbi:PTS IIA-like nitrogen regulatory protein PtsN [Colwellia sp. BRX8-7]|jgi:PTS system nitrogen regulatory IIA component|uniref:PTS IIA-like nitrogen regulatory protein PtsN n=1 Tax=unclassified Colwellia TaxID=196834 RepID=UPI0015F4C3B2|nr:MULTISPECIES: PTS IIA-like nitrogen regulatory protein PtsN [unclassified Colwellia]MBA6362642.1 PTS IIA-like nitrogen regulatory protein PtsN [Colwellia sp. BRX8-8]MBA6338037.1 PTS IIA-like nitrogen regulatory protein PtsN [Colwellia sp. BRX8-7]MBA6350602.1 PTS IIA-like nitrogen regulatory protein PtsN [Colwellia sp. BRX9-1]MBA6370992.1 PTS IIA-like nitrogen regulatory protein PtsN [Colwellia sp. BRX8-4]MBA6382399.1 PTS IIA-like nitrogen regulatory protein PtsN [Colwellia sp. BRX10-9]|tara:strand:- start:1581 stop:2036 length:456 start_codon:yes stop_codon:yes gene_type:complete
MKLQDILTLDCTLCAIKGTSKKKLLEIISETAAKKFDNIDTHQLFESLMAREKVGSTGIGNGIAIPHGRLTNTSQVIAVLLTSEQAVEFDAIDNRAVDIIIALFVPEENCQQHLDTLQSIAQIFSTKQFAKQVRKCQNSQELFTLIKHAKR